MTDDSLSRPPGLALLAGGSTGRIRSVAPGHQERSPGLHEEMPLENLRPTPPRREQS